MRVLNRGSYSAKAVSRLEVAGRSLAIARISRTSMILRETINVPPCDAKIIVNVNGEDNVYPVHLFNGIDRNSRVVQFF